MKKVICGFLSLILCFLSFPVVLADSQTYIIAPKTLSDGILNDNSNFYFYQNNHSEIDGRMVVININAWTSYLYVFNDSSNSVSYSVHYGANGYGGSSTLTYNNNNNTYYYYYISSGSNTTYQNVINQIALDNPEIVYSGTSSNAVSVAFSYTFGENAIDPAPPTPTPPAYAQLSNVGYNTRIAGSGQAAINNLDTVSWNPETDTVGNDISGMSVSIRAVPGKYSASSRQTLAEKLYTDFVLNTLEATVLDTVPASSGSFSVTWANVIDELSLPFATISSLVDQDGTFIKNGWIYQVRLEGENYEGDWQTVYTATSSGVQNDLTIIQSTTINQTLVNTITEINQLNSTTNNWYINETTINMSDYSEPGQGEKPWWAYLLEAIVSLINKVVDGIASIVGAIADLVGDIIDGILGLFTFDSFSVPDFSTHQQNIHDNSGIFGESIDIIQTMDETLSNADSTAQPILYYPGIQLEGVQFIPEITINLNDYVEDLGLTQWHNLAYTCTDILIWTSLIYTIYRKLIGVFKR